MFTGIVTDLGQVRRVRRGELVELTIATGFDTAAIAIGASIACSGPCLTVVAVEDGAFTVQASAETVSRTTIGGWREGDRGQSRTILAARRRVGRASGFGPCRWAGADRRAAA